MLQVGIGFDSSKSVSLAISTFGQVRSLKSASQFLASFWQVGVGSVRQVGWQSQGFGKTRFLFGRERFKKVGFGCQVQSLLGCRVFWLVKLAAVKFIETLLPKIELVVKCCQDSRGSGSKAKESGATRKRLTPFAADSGFAASGDAPRASKGFGQ
jgi:hypothetical protein